MWCYLRMSVHIQVLRAMFHTQILTNATVGSESSGTNPESVTWFVNSCRSTCFCDVCAVDMCVSFVLAAYAVAHAPVVLKVKSDKQVIAASFSFFDIIINPFRISR